MQNESNEVRIQKSKWGMFWTIVWTTWVAGYFTFFNKVDFIEFGIFVIPLIVLTIINGKYGRWH